VRAYVRAYKTYEPWGKKKKKKKKKKNKSTWEVVFMQSTNILMMATVRKN